MCDYSTPRSSAIVSPKATLVNIIMKFHITYWLFFLLVVSCSQSPNKLLNLGYEFLGKGLNEKADSVFSEIIRNDGQVSLAFNGRGMAKKRMGNLEGAIADYSIAIEIDSNPVHISNRAIAYSKLGKYLEAHNDYLLVLERDSGNSDYWFGYGEVLIKLEDYNKAIIVFERLNTQGSGHRLSKVWENLGFCYNKKEERIKAIESYKEAIRVDSSNSIAFNELGAIYLNFGMYVISREIFKESLSYLNNTEDSAFAFYHLGLSYDFLEEKDSACKYYQMSINLGIDESIVGETIQGTCGDITN